MLVVVLLIGLLAPMAGTMASVAPALHGHAAAHVHDAADDGHSHANQGGDAGDGLVDLAESILGHHGIALPPTTDLLRPAAVPASYSGTDRPGPTGREPSRDRDPPRRLTPR